MSAHAVVSRESDAQKDLDELMKESGHAITHAGLTKSFVTGSHKGGP